MAMLDRKLRNGRGDAPRHTHVLRLVASGCVALVLITGAYQAAFANLSASAKPCSNDPNDDLPPCPAAPNYEGGEEGGGLSTGEAVAIGVGAAAGLAALAGTGAIGGLFGANRDCGAMTDLLPNGDARILAPLPSNCTVSELFLAPERTSLDAGACRVFDLRAKCKEDGKCYSVTGRSETTIEVRDIVPGTPVVKLEGSKNTFCVPITAPQTANARSVVIHGTFAPGGKAMSAESRILVRVPGRSTPPR